MAFILLILWHLTIFFHLRRPALSPQGLKLLRLDWFILPLINGLFLIVFGFFSFRQGIFIQDMAKRDWLFQILPTLLLGMDIFIVARFLFGLRPRLWLSSAPRRQALRILGFALLQVPLLINLYLAFIKVSPRTTRLVSFESMSISCPKNYRII